jgi:FMN phosphatase YigB (HAD superfamily)
MVADSSMPDAVKSLSGVRAVFFDVGETLINETTEYGNWADWLGVPRHTFSAVLGQMIAQGRDYKDAFQYFKPDFDLNVERERRAQAGLAEHFDARDLYPDVRPCLEELRRYGRFIGIAGNQTARAGQLLRELNLTADLIATSAEWRVEKPSIDFFSCMASAAGCTIGEILYVGDRLDLDIIPGAAAGLIPVLIRRGPWGYFFAEQPGAATAYAKINSLMEVSAMLRDA